MQSSVGWLLFVIISEPIAVDAVSVSIFGCGPVAAVDGGGGHFCTLDEYAGGDNFGGWENGTYLMTCGGGSGCWYVLVMSVNSSESL